MAFDLRVTELLRSRLCHDLVSPAGAAASALESVANLASVLLPNDIAEREEPDTAARRDASAILAGLDEIRHGLLQGRLSRRVLVDLEGAVRRDRAGISDPALRDLID
jgi:hypothetical protein